MKNSVCTAGLSHAGTPIVLLMRSPIASAKITYSMPQFTKSPLPASRRASHASAMTTGTPTRKARTRAAEERRYRARRGSATPMPT